MPLSKKRLDPRVGYKGKSEADAGYFYCPYVPLIDDKMRLKLAVEEIELEKREGRFKPLA